MGEEGEEEQKAEEHTGRCWEVRCWEGLESFLRSLAPGFGLAREETLAVLDFWVSLGLRVSLVVFLIF